MSSVPAALIAGETLNFSATVADYPAGAGWVLTLYLNPRAGGSVRTVVGTADGDAHLLQASGATTAGWAAGDYAWELWAAQGAERYRLDAGQLRVQPSLIGAAAGLDTRSPARVALDTLRAAWNAFISSGNFTAASYTINGRNMTYRSVAELRAAISAAERDVRSEDQAARVAAGGSPRSTYVVRM